MRFFTIFSPRSSVAIISEMTGTNLRRNQGCVSSEYALVAHITCPAEIEPLLVFTSKRDSTELNCILFIESIFVCVDILTDAA